jgi:hypothetical protein
MGYANTNLRSTLGAKSSWVFNCNKVNQKLKSNGGENSYLFMNSALNDVVIIKELLKGDDPQRTDGSPIGTKLYLPYEPELPDRGGRSTLFDSPDVLPFLEQTVGLAPVGERKAIFEHDFKILTAVDQLPSMDGFLMRDALALKGITADEAYFEVSPEEREAIQVFIRKKMELLVRAAFGGDTPPESKVTQLIDVVWEAKDIQALEPLIFALRCPMKESLAIFGAWKAIMFYSFDYARSEEKRKNLAVWLSKNSRPRSDLPKAYADFLRQRVHEIATRLRAHWISVDTVLQDYNDLYHKFVTSMEPAGFLGFLRTAKEVSCSVGIAMGKISQAIGCLEMMTASRSLTEQNLEILLGQLYGALAPTIAPKAQAA